MAKIEPATWASHDGVSHGVGVKNSKPAHKGFYFILLTVLVGVIEEEKF